VTQYLDVLGIGRVVPQDALEIIDYLNTHPAGAAATLAAAPAVTIDVSVTAVASSAATAAGGDMNSLTAAIAPINGSIYLPVPLQSDTPTVSPAVAAISSPGSAVSQSVQAAIAGSSSTLTSRSPVMLLVASASKPAYDEQQLPLVDAGLSDPLEDWLNG
jgi:hypothetical protein